MFVSYMHRKLSLDMTAESQSQLLWSRSQNFINTKVSSYISYYGNKNFLCQYFCRNQKFSFVYFFYFLQKIINMFLSKFRECSLFEIKCIKAEYAKNNRHNIAKI